MRLSGSIAQIVRVAMVAVLASFALQTHADDLKIGYVNMDRIMRDSVPAKLAEQKLAQEFDKRTKDLKETDARIKALADKLDKDNPVISDPERVKRQQEIQDMDRDFRRRQREFQEDVNQRKNEEYQALLQRAQRAVEQVAVQEKFDLILVDVVYSAPRVDVTDRVLRVLDSAK
jgi:outer membrane protein